ncbi:MAG: cytochrome c biogenesis protein ResB [Verrucomicrobia bacterium]|nr:cytochrome c biogenesis protein ResB [Verrucomicrobiota bacterium]
MNQKACALGAESGVNRRSKPLAKSLFDTLAAVKFAVTVVVLIVAACVAGSILPQGTDVTGYLEKYPAAARRMELFGRLGLTHVFSSWWFVGLLSTLAASVATCSLRRFATVRVASGPTRVRALGSMLTHISILLILAGGVVRGLWGEKGQIELHEGQTKGQFQVESGFAALPFTLRLEDFEIETYGVAKPADADGEHDHAAASSDCCNQLTVQWAERNLTVRLPIKLNVEQVLAPTDEVPSAANSYRLKILRYEPDFAIDMKTREVSSRSSESKNPAILLAVNGPDYDDQTWLFAKYPDFGMHAGGGKDQKPLPLRVRYENHGAAKPAPALAGPVKSFRSTLKVLEGDTVVQTPTVEVNRPFSYKGYTFYQSGYNPQDLSWTSLQVVRDPGVPLVYAGFALIIGGLFIVFYVNPWLQARRAKA